MKKIITCLICCFVLLGITGCTFSNDDDISLAELSKINDKIIFYFQSDNVEYDNYSYNYVDQANKVVVVGLLNNTQEEQNRFKKLVVDSEYIRFEHGDRGVNN